MYAKLREPGEHRYFYEYVEPHLGPGIEYMGGVHHADKLALLGGARALLNPITWPEPFGLVMVEALACGTSSSVSKRSRARDRRAWSNGWWCLEPTGA